jgi:hypothetical protein
VIYTDILCRSQDFKPTYFVSYEGGYFVSTVPEWYVDHQREKSKTREADGQCLGCGTFRLDGKPPTIHRTGCTLGTYDDPTNESSH